MQNFQNAGTYNAGVFSSGKLSVPGMGAGVPTMDEAGVASGGAFLVSELEKRDPLFTSFLTRCISQRLWKAVSNVNTF